MIRVALIALIIAGLIAVLGWAGFHVRIVRAPEGIPATMAQGPDLPEKHRRPNVGRAPQRYVAEFNPARTFRDAQGDLKRVDLSLQPVTAVGETTGAYTLKPSDVFEVTGAPINTRVTADALELTNPETGKGIRWDLPVAPRVELDAPVPKDREKVAYNRAGITWEWQTRFNGAKLTGRVLTPKGPSTYTFPYELIGAASDLSVNPDGSLSGEGLLIAPVVVIDALGNEYEAGPYTLTGGAVQFSFDDSAIPFPANYPYLIDPSTVFCEETTESAITCDAEGTDADDGVSSLVGSTYPPNGDLGGTYGNTSTTILVQKSDLTPNEQNNTGFISWDTSSLPDDAIVTGATLTLYVTATTVTDARRLNVAWYDRQPPFSLADHVSDDETLDLAASTPLSDLTTSADNAIGLNVDENTVSATDNTTLRLTISGGVPSGVNSMTFRSMEFGSDEPTLTVTYVDPVELTVPSIEEILSYENVFESGDLLFLMHYDIDTAALSTLPESPARDTYRAVMNDGNIVWQSVNPVSTSENAQKGYGHGLAAFYFTAADVTANGLTFGSPGVYDFDLEAVDYATTVTTNATSIDFRTTSELRADLIDLGQHFETQWSLDTISNNQLTAFGQDYFETVWPFVCDALEGFCNLVSTSLDSSKSTFGTTEEDRLDTFWDSVPEAQNPKTALEDLGSIVGMGQSEFTLGLVLIGTLIGAVVLVPRGVPAQWVIISGGTLAIFFATIGLVEMEVALFLGLIGTGIVVVMLLLRRAA